MSPHQQITLSLGHWLKTLGYQISINETTIYIEHHNQTITTIYCDQIDSENDTIWIEDTPNEVQLRLSDPHLHPKILQTITQPQYNTIIHTFKTNHPQRTPIETQPHHKRPTSPGPPGTPI
jgi:hypothetical protein